MIRPVQDRCLHESLVAHAGHFLRKKLYTGSKKNCTEKKEILQSLLKDVLQFGKLDRGWICSLL
jgi:hypothetical protein